MDIHNRAHINMLFGLIGIVLAGIKILIEYKLWYKYKDEGFFHRYGYIIMFFIGGVTFLATDYNIAKAVILTCCYWNVFEIGGNLIHRTSVLYSGKNSSWDKAIHYIGGKYYELVKFIMHVITIVLTQYLIFL